MNPLSEPTLPSLPNPKTVAIEAPVNLPKNVQSIISYEEMEDVYAQDPTLQTMLQDLEQMRSEEQSTRQLRAEIDKSFKQVCRTLNFLIRRLPSQQRLIRNRRRILMQRSFDRRLRELRQQICIQAGDPKI